MKFYIVETEIILIKKVNYSEHYLNIKADNVYKINIYISVYLNGAGIVKILNTHQKLSVLKENDMIICDIMGSIICNT